jgi:glycosyltransferase involved in cell wall biosynthesis
MSRSRRRYLFISSNGALWGGSEELWSATAAALAEEGHQVSVLKPNIDQTRPRIQRLSELGCRFRDPANYPFHAVLAGVTPWVGLSRMIRVGLALAFSRPDLVVLSQGGNFDGVRLADVVRRMKRRYVVISQKAGDLYWQSDARLPRARAVYREAVACYFVSEHNLRLTQEMLGFDLPHAAVVRNPFLVPWEPRDDWPSERGGLHLACIGRLYPAEKGQDLLIRVLSRVKWRNRQLSVTIIGIGPNRNGLEAMAAYHGLTSVTFAGFIGDVSSVWNDHHGLILPSRCEGLPLVLVEAMLSGRVPIVTNVAGNSEIVRDGATGFLATAPTEDALDEALERAWQRRDEWRAIGAVAAEEIRTLVPRDPARTLADMLVALTPEGAAEQADERRPAIDTPGA